jgi:hypothetical protein
VQGSNSRNSSNSQQQQESSGTPSADHDDRVITPSHHKTAHPRARISAFQRTLSTLRPFSSALSLLVEQLKEQEEHMAGDVLA